MAVPTNPRRTRCVRLQPSTTSTTSTTSQGEVWRQDPVTDALGYCSVVTMTHRHGDIPERRPLHRNHHAGQVRLNSSGAGITAGGAWYALMHNDSVCS